MSQTWTDDTYAAGHTAATDLQNIKNNFACLKSLFSGAASPAGTVAFMPWGDTAQKVLKIRNDDDTAWWGLMHGDTSEKRLVYRDAAMEGYARDSSVTDRVIALKGGSTYTTGAASAGSWTVSGITSSSDNAHNHQWYNNIVGGSPDQSWDSDGVARDMQASAKGGTGNALSIAPQDSAALADMWTSNASAHSHTISQNGTWRILAAVVILIYLDL